MTDEAPSGIAPDAATRAGDPVETTVSPVGGGPAVSATFQPWAAGAGGIFVAWQIGPETGALGIASSPGDQTFEVPDAAPEAEGIVWLGDRGCPAGDGQYRSWVALGAAAAEELAEGFDRCHRSTQSPSAGATPLTVTDTDHQRVDPERAESLVDPVPSDAAAVGDRHVFELFWWGPRTVGICQAWRPRDAGAVYVAWAVAPPVLGDDAVWDGVTYGGTLDSGTHGVLTGALPLVRLGRGRAMRWVFFFHPDTADAFDGLVADVVNLRSDGPDLGYRTA
ncbi:hypothetical protein ACFQMA_12665 [Halosimplex aquaticum]|uniref:Uncharacterized protein n=1 Tax=Halosimplex aquaticum TaxID=3026162 RepID=A0ABD5XZU7_9EURY|nr:hypothetical protein [Halosimplex aquaticum]